MVSAEFFELIPRIDASRNRGEKKVGRTRCISVNEKRPATQRVSPEKKATGSGLHRLSVRSESPVPALHIRDSTQKHTCDIVSG